MDPSIEEIISKDSILKNQYISLLEKKQQADKDLEDFIKTVIETQPTKNSLVQHTKQLIHSNQKTKNILRLMIKRQETLIQTWEVSFNEFKARKPPNEEISDFLLEIYKKQNDWYDECLECLKKLGFFVTERPELGDVRCVIDVIQSELKKDNGNY